MSRYFKIKITSGTAPGPYTIYYDSMVSSNIATIYDVEEPAVNISHNDLTNGDDIVIYVPHESNFTGSISYNVDL